MILSKFYALILWSKGKDCFPKPAQVRHSNVVMYNQRKLLTMGLQSREMNAF